MKFLVIWPLLFEKMLLCWFIFEHQITTIEELNYVALAHAKISLGTLRKIRTAPF